MRYEYRIRNNPRSSPSPVRGAGVSSGTLNSNHAGIRTSIRHHLLCCRSKRKAMTPPKQTSPQRKKVWLVVIGNRVDDVYLVKKYAQAYAKNESHRSCMDYKVICCTITFTIPKKHIK